jgi:hypothetical protein
MTRMNWRRAHLYGRPTLDHRHEFNDDVLDRTKRWLKAVDRRQKERRSITPSSSVRQSSVTAGSSEVPR